MPHSMSSAADPATSGVDMEVPDSGPKPPPGKADSIFSPGATRSGLTGFLSLSPLPEKLDMLSVAES